MPVDKSIYWTFPKLSETCSDTNASSLIQLCYNKGKCDQEKHRCKCSHKYMDPVSHCQYSIFDVYEPYAMAFPLVRSLFVSSSLRLFSFSQSFKLALFLEEYGPSPSLPFLAFLPDCFPFIGQTICTHLSLLLAGHYTL